MTSRRSLIRRAVNASSDIETEEKAMVDDAKLNAFIGKVLGDLGGAFSVPLVRAWATGSASTRRSKIGVR
jgi:hypothetical protein